jgi:ankyrin repeat protein
MSIMTIWQGQVIYAIKNLWEVDMDMLTRDENFDDVTISPGFAGVTRCVGPNSRGLNGETALHWMVYLGDAKAIRILIDSLADVDAADNEGNTPQHSAVASGQVSAIQTLLDHGADQYKANVQCVTPLMLAQTDEHLTSLLLRRL